MTAPAEPASPGWRPSAPWANLRRRAQLAAATRAFFAERGVLEVTTPSLAAAPVTAPHLHSLETRVQVPGSGPGTGPRRLFLQTSPEHAMKRLLAAGSGPIYQLGPAFRDGEAGRRHNPEFTLLEWYRPGFDHHALMDEMDDLLAHLLETSPADRLPYGQLFEERLGVDPHRAPAEHLARVAAKHLEHPPDLGDDRDGWLDLLMALALEPTLGMGSDGRRPLFLYDYPASQAALARIRPADGDHPPVAERFEVYLRGVELANGFHELGDAAEQRRRFEADLEERRRRGLPQLPLDENLLAALEAGLPPSAGVALGFDRLVMLAVGAKDLRDVLAFPVDRA